jgi:AraC-like DNA-binding protein
VQEPLSLSEICTQLGVSSRALQLAFKQHLGQGPMSYLRDLRLDSIRHALSTAESLLQGPSDPRISISQLAARYNFLHLGHFAEQYQKRFGELPTQTLKGNRDGRPRKPGDPFSRH